ncbi:MAG: ribonuclease P protein component [Patescibacteria group bacterium]
MLPKLHRLTKGSDFKRVYSTGRNANGRRLRLKLAPNGLKQVRVGVVVANSVSKHATKRNKVKRLIREAIRVQLAHIKPGMDIVISANNPSLTATFQDMQSELAWLLTRAKLRT